MRAHILTIGDEILIGQIIDTNASFIAQQLDKIGIEVSQIRSIADTNEEISEALTYARGRAEVVLITGGLGPTKDDLTKQAFCEFFDDNLVENKEVLDHIEGLFKHQIKRPILEANKGQAMVPAKATILPNRYGTAPGMWMNKEGVVYIAMPGVPYEMKALMTDEILPRLQKEFERPYILHKTIQTYGRGESEIAETLEDWENNLPPQIKLAYLPAPGRVRLRLSTRGMDLGILQSNLQEQTEELEALLGDIILGYDDSEPLEALLGSSFREKNASLALAESCTGGQLAVTLTSIPGTSAFFKGGLVTYATETKVEVLGVSSAVIETHSVVSAEVAVEMARCAQRLYKADYALATTGNAGPEKGDSDAEVGTVFIGVATPENAYAEKFMMGKNRERVITKTVNKAMELLQKELLKK